MSRHNFIMVIGAAGAIAISASAVAAPTYTITDLGSLGGKSFNLVAQGYAINSKGEATGLAVPQGATAYSPYRPFLYSAGVMTDIGTLGRWSFGADINDGGSIVGFYVSAAAEASMGAFLYTGGKMVDIGVLPGAVGMRAEGINNSNQVVGSADFGGPQHAFLYSAGSLTDLGTLGGRNSNAFAINDAGQITGFASRANGQQVPFVYDAGVMTDIFSGTLITSGLASGINSNGDLAGTVIYFGRTLPFTRVNGVLTVFEVPGEGAYGQAINDAGAFVGSLENSPHALVAYGGGYAYLNDLMDPVSGAGWDLANAFGINNNGQIVGVGILGGEGRAFIATCVSGCGDPLPPMAVIDVTVPLPSAIPEPETNVLMLVGLGVVGLVARRRKGIAA